MLSNVASTVSNVVDLGRPEIAAACSFAAMVGGNMDDVRDITCKMIDQVSRKQVSSCSPSVLTTISCHASWQHKCCPCTHLQHYWSGHVRPRPSVCF